MVLCMNMIMDHWTEWQWEKETVVLWEKPVPLLLAEFLLNFESCKKIKTHILCSINFFSPKIVAFRWRVEKYDRNRQLSDDNIIWFMRSSCWVPKATNTHSENVIFIVFPTATVVTPTRLNVMFIQYQSCCILI